MNTLKSLILLVLISGISFTSSAQFEKAEVQVRGMTCSMCQLAAEKALKTIDYVSDIKADLNNNSYTLTFNKNKQVNLSLVKKKIEDAGFSVGRLVATFNFNKTAISNNSSFIYDGNTYRFMNVQNKVLNGDVKIMLISNGYLSASDFKKYSAQSMDSSYKKGISGKETIFQVTLVAN